MQNKYTFYRDDGHGWLETPIEDVKTLGMKITNFSYCKGRMLYLEEDNDAVKFLSKYKQQFSSEPIIKIITHDGSSRIRNYQDNIPEELLV